MPPVDLSQPLQNPALLAAIDRFYESRDLHLLRPVLQELRRANLLVAAFFELTDANDAPPGLTQFTKIPAGTRLSLPTVVNDQELVLLPLFTDWEELRAYAAAEFPAPPGPLQGLVMPFADAAGRVDQNGYAGVLVNPSRQRPIELRSDQIRAVLWGNYPPAEGPIPGLWTRRVFPIRHACGATLHIDEEELGQPITCRTCGENFTPRRSEDGAPDLARAIQEMCQASPPPRARRIAYEALMRSELLIGAFIHLPDGTELRPGPDTDLSQIPNDAKVGYWPVHDREGNRFVAAFTSWERLRSANPGIPALPMAATAALDAVVKGGFSGLLIDAESDYGISVSAQQAQRLLVGELPPE